jgi:hypothetical protein
MAPRGGRRSIVERAEQVNVNFRRARIGLNLGRCGDLSYQRAADLRR